MGAKKKSLLLRVSAQTRVGEQVAVGLVDLPDARVPILRASVNSATSAAIGERCVCECWRMA